MSANNFSFDFESKFSTNILVKDKFFRSHGSVTVIDNCPIKTVGMVKEKYSFPCAESCLIRQLRKAEVKASLKNIGLLEAFKYNLFTPEMSWYNSFGDINFSDVENDDSSAFKIFIVDVSSATFLLRNFVSLDSEKYIEQFQNMLDDSSFENMVFVCCNPNYTKNDFYKYLKFFNKENFISILKNFNKLVLELNTWYELCYSFASNASPEEIQLIYERIYLKRRKGN